MAYAINPYKELETIYNAKVGYGNAATDAERNKYNQIATKARKTLSDYDYGNLVSQVSADGATASDVKKILDSYKPVTNTATGTYKTGVTGSPAFDVAVNESLASNKKREDTVYSDRSDVQGKYNDIYNYANQDVTKTDEYKSAFNNIMPYYNYQAMMGRDNQLASGAASNGGNIDSYAAANAMRQQAALTSKGQMLAHQMGLDAYNSRISNITNILNNLGVYNNSTYAALQQSVNNYDRTANTISNALNDQTDRLVKQSSVTGYIPKEWQYSNNPYFNTDGTLKDVYTSEAFDNDGGFTTIINNAEAQLKTETDPVKRANLEATINYANQAKAYKTGAFEKYAKWASEVMGTTPEETAEMKQFRTNNDTVLKTLNAETGLKEKEINANVQMNADNNASAIDQINANAEAQKSLLDYQLNNGVVLDEDGNVVSVAGREAADGRGTINFIDDHFEQDTNGNYYAKKIPVGDIEGTDENGNLIADNPELKRSNSLGLDRNGDRMVNAVLDHAAKNGGKLSMDAFIEFIVGHSNEYNTDVRQLKKVLAYFGIDASYLDEYGVDNAGAIGWGDGVKRTTQE